jgi:hypothetical protein
VRGDLKRGMRGDLKRRNLKILTALEIPLYPPFSKGED